MLHVMPGCALRKTEPVCRNFCTGWGRFEVGGCTRLRLSGCPWEISCGTEALDVLRAVSQRVRATGIRVRCAHLNEYNLPVVIRPDVAHFLLKSQEIFVSTLGHADLFSFGTGLFDTRIEEIKESRFLGDGPLTHNE